MIRWRAAMGLLLAALTWVAVTAADEPPAGDSAADLFASARQHYHAKRFGDALPLFEAAWRQTRSPNARLFLARCLRELGRMPEAYEQMRATVNDARARADEDPRYVDTHDAAAAELALLEARISRVIVAVDALPPDAQLTLNGKRLSPEQIGTPIAIVPGPVTVQLDATGRPKVEKTTSVTPGTIETVTLSLPATTSGRGTRKSPHRVASGADTPTEVRSSGGGVRLAGFVVAALGTAGLVAGGVAEAVASSEYGALKEACGAGPCPDASYDAGIDRGQTAETVAGVAFTTGAVALAGGLVMILAGGSSDALGEAVLRVGPGAAGISWWIRF